MQLDASAALRSLLHAVGFGARFDEAALLRSGLRKGSSDDLRRSLLNFEQLHAALRPIPCLQEMLSAPTPRRFGPECADVAEAKRQHVLEAMDAEDAQAGAEALARVRAELAVQEGL